MIAGICGGLAETYGWEISVVRLITALGIIFSGSIIFFAYIIAWIIVPEEPFIAPPAVPPPPTA
jgi:phage shock protein C